MKRILLPAACAICTWVAGPAHAQHDAPMPEDARNPAPADQAPTEADMAAYLLVYFSDDTHSVHMAISHDGYAFTAVNDGEPVIDGRKIALQRGVRDPHITRGPDGRFYMAMTDLHIFAQREGLRDTRWERPGEAWGWGNNRALVLMHSDDLIHWTHTNLRVDLAFPELRDIGSAWAPQLIYDPRAGKMMVYFSMRFRNGLTRIYYSHLNDDFNALESPPRLLFEHPKNVAYIDGDITRVGDKYHLFYVSQEATPGIKHAVSQQLETRYSYRPDWVDPEPAACEAPNLWKRIGEQKWVLMYDIFGIQPHNFGFVETTDFETFQPLGRFNQGPMKATNFTAPKHGAVIHLTAAEADRLEQHWARDPQ